MAQQAHNPNRNRNPRDGRPYSFLIDDYRSNRYPNLQLSDIVSHVVEFALDRKGSKFIQKKLSDAPEARKESIFRELCENMFLLMTDRFANFVVQKFFEMGSAEHKHDLVTFLHNNFIDLSLNLYGCRVIQKGIEKSPLISQLYIIRNIRGFETVLATDSHANHVLQSCFRHIPPIELNFIVRAMYERDSIKELCMSLHGCRVIQRILELGTDDQKIVIFDSIQPDVTELAQHRYGNYVIQQALGL